MNENDLYFKRLFYPRVSEIYQMYTSLKYGYINPDVLKHAQERGTRTHDYCKDIVSGKPFDAKQDHECAPYVNSFKLWYEKEVEEVIFMEKRLYDYSAEFSGEPDLLVKLKNRDGLKLIDLKTPASVQKSWLVQLGGYIQLLEVNGYKVDGAIILRLRDTGAYPLIKEYTDEESTQGKRIFSNCLENYNFFIRKKEKKHEVKDDADD